MTTLDAKLARTMEPRASTPPKRLEALRQLSEAGIPSTVMVAPVIPALNDSEIERILDAAAHAGAKEASYVLLRLPLEVRDLFPRTMVKRSATIGSTTPITSAGVDERHLEVDLRELRLPVGAQVLVPEAARRSGSSGRSPTTMRICLKSCGDCGSA